MKDFQVKTRFDIYAFIETAELVYSNLISRDGISFLSVCDAETLEELIGVAKEVLITKLMLENIENNHERNAKKTDG